MPDIKIDELENLVRLMEKKNIYYVDLKREDKHIRMRRFPESVIEQNNSRNDPGISSGSTITSPPPDTTNKNHQLLSLLVGVFHRAISRDSMPAVSAGDIVKKGQTVAYIETMKIMHDVKADTDGKILSFLAGDSHVVEYGQPIIEMEVE